MKDFDKSVVGLTSKLALLNEKLVLQQKSVAEYEKALNAAKEQLQAAQQVSDPDKIRQATDAVQDAETALNNARAAVKQTKADIANCNKELKTAQSEWTKAGKSTESFGKACDAAGKNLIKAGKLLSTTLTTPIAALGTAAVKASIDFESSFASVRKTVDATEAQFDQLAATSKKMSTEVAAGTDEINEVMAAGGQLGVVTEHLSDFTRVMIDLGNSCEDLNANDAATTIAQFANIMGTSQSQFSNIGSTLVDLGNNFATTEKPIMDMAHRMAGAGKQVGLTEAQVLGFAAALSSVGIEAQMGGSAFSKALIKMEVASATGGDALEDFGRVAGMTAQQFKTLWDSDPAAAFEAFIVGLSKLDEEGESAIAVLDEIGIKEVRLRDTMLRAVNATDLFSRAQNMATSAWKKNSALSEEANKRYSTTESKLKNLKNTALLFGQQIGDDLNPTIQKRDHSSCFTLFAPQRSLSRDLFFHVMGCFCTGSASGTTLLEEKAGTRYNIRESCMNEVNAHDHAALCGGKDHLSEPGKRLYRASRRRQELQGAGDGGGQPAGRKRGFCSAASGGLEGGSQVRESVLCGEMGRNHAGHHLRH